MIMKELSIEQKARAYDEAIEKLRNAFYNNNSRMCEEYRNATLKIIEPIFPELEESEDERIRKWIVRTLKSLNNSSIQIDGAYEMMLPAIAWLEKKDEKKPADKPKFKAGDIIKPKDGSHEPWQIMQVDMLDKKYRFKDGYVIHFSQEDVYELVEQKPAWSEEDETALNDIIMCGERHCYLDAGNIAWLKNLKNRLLPQPKQDSTDRFFEGFKKGEQSVIENYGKYGLCKPTKWSEDDERLFQIVIDTLVEAGQRDSAKWLKSLKDRVQSKSQWKPSDEQMKALANALSLAKNCGEESAFDLRTLHEQLKKLREE